VPLVSDDSEEYKEHVEFFRWFRGGYLSAFSQAEFTLGRLVSRFNLKPFVAEKYNNIQAGFSARLSSFSSLFSDHDMLAEYREWATLSASELEARYARRNFLAHGFARFEASTEQWDIRRIKYIKGNPWNEETMTLTPSDFIPISSRMSINTQRIVEVAMQLNIKFDLEF
jgi:hypothetical protein